jgi:outer membrane protein OmpA-like peptidoglycan-associated protein
MKHFFSRFLLVICLFTITIGFAKSKGIYVYPAPPLGIEVVCVPETLDTPSTSENSGSSSDGNQKGKKDSQIQTQYMKPDMDATEYNFYDRKKISTPLMPRYDLDSAVYQKGFARKEAQQKAFIENKYRYPARPKDQWEISLQGGSSLISGDIKPNWGTGWGGGLSVRKAVNYFFSLRLSYIFSLIKDQDLKPRQDTKFDPALSSTGADHADYAQNTFDPAGNMIPGESIIFHNYKNTSHMVHLDGIINLGNILFHKERTLVSPYVFFGVGFHLYRTQELALDKNGKIFDYEPIDSTYNAMTASHISQSTINSVISGQLKNLQSGGQYIDAIDPLQKGYLHVSHFYLVPDFSVGAGIDFHVSKWVTLGIEERFVFNDNSNLDGINWQDDSHPGLAPHYDHYFSTMIRLNFQIGKNALEPLWWLNPLDFTYKRLSDANPDKLAKDLFKDSDDDGVPDRLDREPNTKKGCPVDAHGVILDSDKDGIPDCDDKEPFSPPGYPIDQNGVAIIPPNPCCDNAAPGGGGDTLFDANGKPVIGADGKVVMTGGGPDGNGTGAGKNKRRGGGGQYDCSKMEMPGVFFDDDKYYIDPAYQSALHQVAEKLQMCPDVKMVITGVDESKNDQKYNEQLAYNRATSVADYLVEKYGISRDRFVVKYQGGKKSDATKTPSERKNARRVDFTYAADGDKGDSNPPAPHPGLKAGSNK